MKLQDREVQAVDVYQSITWAATFAVKEAIDAGVLTEKQATHIMNRMNTILDWLGDNKIVTYNTTTRLFEPHDVTEATERDAAEENPDVLVINGD